MPTIVQRSFRLLVIGAALVTGCATAPPVEPAASTGPPVAPASHAPRPPADAGIDRATAATETPTTTCATRAPRTPIQAPALGSSSGSCKQNDVAEQQLKQTLLSRWKRTFARSRIDIGFDCMPVSHELHTIVYTEDEGAPVTWLFTRADAAKFHVLSITRSRARRPPFAFERGSVPASAIDTISDRLRSAIAVVAREVPLGDGSGTGHATLSARDVSVELLDARGGHAERAGRLGSSDMRTVLPLELASEMLQPLTAAASEPVAELTDAERELLFAVVWRAAGRRHPVRSIETAIEIGPLFDLTHEVPLLLSLIERTDDDRLLELMGVRLAELTGFVPPRDPAYKVWNARAVADRYRRSCKKHWIRS